jgi:hypothetical protein
MMDIYVLQASDDKGRFLEGKVPAKILLKTFGTDYEAEAYLLGLAMVAEMVSHHIVGEEPTLVSVEFDQEVAVDYRFDSVGEKDAYKAGLADGDGYRAPLVITENNEPDFTRIEMLYRRQETDAKAAK